MTEHPEKDIASLLSLLDDEDESIAVYAMGELLDRESRLGNMLGILQESPDPLLRRRVHQLQAAITLRQRRRRFQTLLNMPDFDLKQGLIEAHLQWFDNDSRPDIEKRWTLFFASANNGEAVPRLADLARQMRKCGMTAVPESAMIPENYCIGTVLENRTGAASLLCAAGWVMLGDPSVRAVRVLGEFGLLDGDRKLLLPQKDWQLSSVSGTEQWEYWDRRSLLKFISFMLFSHAVTSDSFRYIQTIGQALSGGPDGMLPETLPYPYCSNAEPDSPEEPAPEH